MPKDSKSKTDSCSLHLILHRSRREKCDCGWALRTKTETYFPTLLDKCQKLLIEQLHALQDLQSNAFSPTSQESSKNFKLLGPIRLTQPGEPSPPRS